MQALARRAEHIECVEHELAFRPAKHRKYNTRFHREHRDTNDIFSGLLVILNGGVLPTVVDEYAWFAALPMLLSDARMVPYTKIVGNQRTLHNERWGILPAWYQSMSGTKRGFKALVYAQRLRQGRWKPWRDIADEGLTPEAVKADIRQPVIPQEDWPRLEREDEAKLYERARNLQQGTYQTHCVCGGASNEECTTLMRAVCKQAESRTRPARAGAAGAADDDASSWEFTAPAAAATTTTTNACMVGDASVVALAAGETTPTNARCCLCSFDVLPVPDKVDRQRAIVAGACRWCRRRVSWFLDGEDQVFDSGCVQISQLMPRAGDDAHAATFNELDFIESLMDWHSDNAAEMAEKKSLIIDVVQMMRFRLRHFVSVSIAPRSTSAHHVPALAANMAPDVPLAQRVQTLGNIWFRTPLDATLRMAGRRVAPEPDDDLAYENDDAQKALAQRIASASYFATALELLALTHHQELLAPYIVHADEADAPPEWKAVVTDLLAPLRSSRQVRRYCRRARERERTFPLCASALAESTAHGGVAFNTMASNTALPIHERLQHMLYDGKIVRPLAAGAPLLQELALSRWYDAPDEPVAPAQTTAVAPSDAAVCASIAESEDDGDDDETAEERTLRSRTR